MSRVQGSNTMCDMIHTLTSSLQESIDRATKSIQRLSGRNVVASKEKVVAKLQSVSTTHDIDANEASRTWDRFQDFLKEQIKMDEQGHVPEEEIQVHVQQEQTSRKRKAQLMSGEEPTRKKYILEWNQETRDQVIGSYNKNNGVVLKVAKEVGISYCQCRTFVNDMIKCGELDDIRTRSMKCKWTKEETNKLIDLLIEHGDSHNDISRFCGILNKPRKRVVAKINYLRSSGRYGDLYANKKVGKWSLEETRELEKLMEKYGDKDYKKITENGSLNRSYHQVMLKARQLEQLKSN